MPTDTPPATVRRTSFYFSTTRSEFISGVGRIADEDIVRFDVESGQFSLTFDGSAQGLPRDADVNALALLSDGSILMSFQDSLTVPGISEVVDDSDLLLFDGAAYSLYLDGSDVGLTQREEDIDALGLTVGGELVVSTAGSFTVDGLDGSGEDLILFYAASLGTTTSGVFDMYFDGDDVDLSSSREDVGGTCLIRGEATYPEVYLTTRGRFSVPGLQGSGDNVFRFQPESLGPSTGGTFDRGVFFDAGEPDMGAFDLDAIWVATDSRIEATMGAATTTHAHSTESILHRIGESILVHVRAWIPARVRAWASR